MTDDLLGSLKIATTASSTDIDKIMKRSLQLFLPLCLSLGLPRYAQSSTSVHETIIFHESQVESSDASSQDIVEYGVDVSYPMHHAHVSENYPWLPHNVDPNVPSPPEYNDMPLQPLGDRQKFYNNLLKDCEEHFNKNSKGTGRGDRCREGEKQRIEMALRQPRSMQVSYTMIVPEIGFKSSPLPVRSSFWF